MKNNFGLKERVDYLENRIFNLEERRISDFDAIINSIYFWRKEIMSQISDKPKDKDKDIISELKDLVKRYDHDSR